MGLGGYLAARSDAEHYDSEQLRQEQEVRDIPAAEAKEVARHSDRARGRDDRSRATRR